MRFPFRLLPIVFFILLSAFITLQLENIFQDQSNNDSKDNIQVMLDAKVLRDDVFQVYYLPSEGTAFNDNSSLRLQVYGANKRQFITFDLPVDSIGGLRIDLGQELQHEMEIHNVWIIKGEKEIEIPFNSIEKYFDINQYIALQDKGLLLKEIDGAYDPFVILKTEGAILATLYQSYQPNLLLARIGVFTFLLVVLLVLGNYKQKSFSRGAFLNLGISAASYVVLLLVLHHFNVNKFYSSDKVTIAVKAKVQKPDFFQFFYTTPESVDFTEGNSIRLFVDAKDDFQVVEFALPTDVNVRQLRLDISEDETQPEVILQSIRVEHNGKSIELLAANSVKHMYANEYMTIDVREGVSLKPRLVNDIYDPFLYSADITSYYQPIQQAERIYPVAEVMALLISLSFFLFLQLAYPASLVPKQQLMPVAMSATFLLLITAPYLKNVFWQGSVYENHENRVLAPAPSMVENRLSEYPQAFTAYFNDNFGFRNELIEVGRDIRLGLFKESFMPEKVALGKDGWLFLSGEYDKIIDDFARRNLYDSVALKKVVDQTMQKKALVEANGGRFYKVFYPNSHSIYPELLPYQIQVQKVDTLSRVDQVNQHLRKAGHNFQVIDVRDELIAAKKDKQVYLKHDTHWNDYGAFIGYNKLFSEIARDLPELQPKAIADYLVNWKMEGDGDLLHIMGVRNFDAYKELKPHFTLKNQNKLKPLAVYDGPYEKSVIHLNPNNDGPVALVFHDSFTIAMRQFISPHFKKVIYYWGNFNPQVVESERPDIVIEGNVERYFH